MDATEIAKTIGANIARERKARGKTQGSLADRVGVAQSRLSKIEGGSAIAGIALLLKIAAALGCPLLSLIKGVGADADAYRKGYEDGWRAAGNAMHVALLKGPDAGAFL